MCAIACTRSFNFLRFTWYAFLQTFLLAKDKREIAFHQIITQQVNHYNITQQVLHFRSSEIGTGEKFHVSTHFKNMANGSISLLRSFHQAKYSYLYRVGLENKLKIYFFIEVWIEPTSLVRIQNLISQLGLKGVWQVFLLWFSKMSLKSATWHVE